MNAFCDWLTKTERAAGSLPAGLIYRLPTEAEWAYACRGGRRDSSYYWWGNDLNDAKGRLKISAIDFLPGEGVDLEILGRTVDRVVEQWEMPSTWGWDFPWLAMAAARVGKPHDAVDALLMDVGKNEYSLCGINKGGPAAT